MADLLRSKTVAAALGLFTHFIANNGEWDHHVHLLVPSGSLFFGALLAFEYVVDPRVSSLFQAFQVVATATAVHLATLTTSVVVYRAFFHRLKKVQHSSELFASEYGLTIPVSWAFCSSNHQV